MINFQTKKVISVQDWDQLVINTYGRPYSFQQQDGCKDRGIHKITIPDGADDYENETIPEIVNGEEMGVTFEAWLARDPKQTLNGEDSQETWSIDLLWTRNFYPDVQMIANDLHAKGLIPEGDYVIEIDW